MRHALLFNPFNLHPEAGLHPEPTEIRNGRSKRVTPVCSSCHSDDIISHATAQWSNESQEWELANTFDQPAHCNQCNSPRSVHWVPIN
jgi:hypothetical protein